MMNSVASQRGGVSSSGSPSSGTDSDGDASTGLRRSLGAHGRSIENADEKLAHQLLPQQYWRPRGDSSTSTSDFSAHATPTMLDDGPARYRPTERVGAGMGSSSMSWNAVDDTGAPRKKRKRKYRKGTHTIRKVSPSPSVCASHRANSRRTYCTGRDRGAARRDCRAADATRRPQDVVVSD